MTLAAGETLRIEPGRDVATVRCDRGTVLVTQSGDLVDHVLAAGQTFTAARAGRVVAWALVDAAITVDRRTRARSRPLTSRVARPEAAPAETPAGADACAPSSACTGPRARRPA
jgi:uncharacterized membrane protein